MYGCTMSKQTDDTGPYRTGTAGRSLQGGSECPASHPPSPPPRGRPTPCERVVVDWDGVSGFGRIRWRVGFRWIRVDSEQPRRGVVCRILQSAWALDPIKMDSVEGRIDIPPPPLFPSQYPPCHGLHDHEPQGLALARHHKHVQRGVRPGGGSLRTTRSSPDRTCPAYL